MKLKMNFITTAIIVALLFTNCSNKTKEICDCIKKAANTQMIKGEKASEQDLVRMCSQFEGELKNADIEDKRIVESCLDSVKYHVNEKILFQDVESVKLPDIPCDEKFIDEINNVYKNATYDKEKASSYYFKNRNINCSMVVRVVTLEGYSDNSAPKKFKNNTICVEGHVYNNNKIHYNINILIPEKDYPKIKKAISAYDLNNVSKNVGRKLFLQIINFSGTILDFQIGKNSLNQLAYELYVMPNSYELIDPNPEKNNAKYEDGDPLFYFGNETKNETKTTTEESSNISSDLIGNYIGDFGKDKLNIVIESIDENGAINGYDEVKGNRRKLTGSKKGNSITLKEPGDDKWDGIFYIIFENNSLTGSWKANNGKSSKEFKLIKIK